MTKRDRIKQKTDGRCGYCGCDIPGKWQVDHIDSRLYHLWYCKDKDPNRDENLIASCNECNHYKRAHPVTGI